MKGFQFFAEYASNAEKRRDTRKRLTATNVIAVYLDTWHVKKLAAHMEADWYTTALSPYPANPLPNTTAVCHTEVSREYLRERCKRISEQEARRIHPYIFTILDSPYNEIASGVSGIGNLHRKTGFLGKRAAKAAAEPFFLANKITRISKQPRGFVVYSEA